MFKKHDRNDRHFSILDAMAAAAQRFEKLPGPVKTRDSLAGCMKKAAKGTHVYVGFGGMHCWYNKQRWYQQGLIVEGQETLLTIPCGFAMRKDYHLRRQINLIARKIGGDGLELPPTEGCWSGSALGRKNVKNEIHLPHIHQLFVVIGVGCLLSLVFLSGEFLVAKMSA
ncbi:hypothetical protein HPB48_023099 [Haemaphysalis longicornis]|uniref:Uncharacterized protein n=1 Tax=Haemaphysalis longicornis TaxID=44386 RepID=A0A9J6GNB3_HAELO|nr:hypothetical protein HPB48_023099 [Haemaphysalis longicornis]